MTAYVWAISGYDAQSVDKLYTLPSTTKDIGETLSTLHAQEKLQNHQGLMKVFLPFFFCPGSVVQ